MRTDVDEGMDTWKSEDNLCVSAQVLPCLFQSGSLIGQVAQDLAEICLSAYHLTMAAITYSTPAVPVSLCGSGVYECQ